MAKGNQKIADEKHGGGIGNIAVHGHESNFTTWKLAWIAIHGMGINLGVNSYDRNFDNLRRLLNLRALIKLSKTFKNFALTLGCLVLAGGLATGCKPSSSQEAESTRQNVAAPSSNEEQSPESSECGFIVRSIVTDLAQQIYFGGKTCSAAAGSSVEVRAKNGPSLDEPTFTLQIRLGTNVNDVKCDLPIKGPLWSPEVYRELAVQLANAVGLEAGHASKTNTFFLDRMRSLNPDEMVRADKAVSRKLQDDFSNAEFHGRGGDHSGLFRFPGPFGKFF